MQYCSNIFAFEHHEKDVSKSLITNICSNNAILWDDNLILVSKAFQNKTPILEIENFFCVLN